MEEIKAMDYIIKVHITSGNIKCRSFALRFCASNPESKSHGDLHLSFLHFILWQAHCVGKILIYIYPIGCKAS